MNRKFARWTAGIVAAAALPAAAIIPAAGSASAATLPRTAAQPAAAASGFWSPLQAYPGTYPLDLVECVLGEIYYYEHVFPETPLSDFTCVGQLYSPDLGNYYELEIYL